MCGLKLRDVKVGIVKRVIRIPKAIGKGKKARVSRPSTT